MNDTNCWWGGGVEGMETDSDRQRFWWETKESLSVGNSPPSYFSSAINLQTQSADTLPAWYRCSMYQSPSEHGEKSDPCRFIPKSMGEVVLYSSPHTARGAVLLAMEQCDSLLCVLWEALDSQQNEESSLSHLKSGLCCLNREHALCQVRFLSVLIDSGGMKH